ncbi:M81 family metallopeptidase [Chryseomicrobium palamuruense]|uniref:M81 family metallopeptidase n=1 Tax=Chryseomicrobium palamuruense TaxID=682973 RepID=A0ABV8UWC7_9BACL
MKLLIGEILHETNTFSNVKTDVEAFKLWGWNKGEDLLSKNRNVRNYLGGMIDQAEALGIGLIPTFATFAYPAGIITSEAYEALLNELIEGIKSADGYDAILLALHGAGVSEVTEDLEGSILSKVREVIGNHIPIVVTLDLHANVTFEMVKHATLILGNHLYPHTDSYEIGMEAVDCAVQIIEGNLKPTMFLRHLPLMIPTSTTNLPPAKEVNNLCFEWEKSDQVVDCTFYHGFPYTNISQVGVSVLVTTNNSSEYAEDIANKISEYIWDNKEKFLQKQPSPEEGIELALAHVGKPVVINETSDNPGGGTPADGTYLLKAMINKGIEKSCFGFIFDPEVVKQAVESGIGTTIETQLGGKTDSLHGEPIQLKAYVKSITDGVFIQSSPMGKGSVINLGPSVRLQSNGVDIIVCSVKAQTLDEQIFLLHGIDVQDYKIVALKSSQHFRAGFEPISSKIITVDSPGLTTLDFTSFKYTNLKTEVYPLSEVLIK